MSVSALLRPTLVLASTLALVGASGCSGGHDALEKDVSELRAEISRLRAAQAAMSERLDAVTMGRTLGPQGPQAPQAGGVEAPGPKVATTTSPREGDRPELDIVKLAPSGPPGPNEGDGDVDNDPARPVLRAVGSGSERPTLNNRSIAQRGPKKGITNANPAKTDDKPTVKQ